MGKEELEAFSTEAKYRGTMAIDATASNLAKKIGGFSTADTSRICTNGRS